MTALSASGVRVLLIGTGTHHGPTLTSVPAVPRTVEALAARLVERCGVAPEQLRTLIDPASAQDMATAIAEEAQRAESTLLIYYVGHGLIGPADELYLAASGTDRLTPGLAAHQALPLSALREALTVCRASSVIVVLDCCFSGRAVLGTRTPPRPPVLNLPAGHGIYLLGSAEQLASAPEDTDYTTFTGELITLLDRGDPRGPRLLTLDDVYDYLFRALRARGGPLPRRQAGDRSGGLVITVNAAAPQPPVPDPRVEEPGPGRCPYPALESFTVDDAEFFHGRDRLVGELLDACARSVERGQPLIVVGPSGAGKTSLLHAGLLAGLRGGARGLPGSASWPCIVLTPGEHPLASLAGRLHPDGVAGSEALRGDPEIAARLIPELVPEQAPESRLVVVVDQLEELFTACRSQPEQRVFLTALTAMSRAGALVVVALRADFYGQAQALPGLAAVLQDNQVLAGPMRQDELRAAIEQPAAVAGLEFDEGLVDLLLHELGAAHLPQAQAGVLPLLSHTLWATWQQRSGRRLTVAGYRDSGGIGGAIAHTADETYAQLDQAGRNAVRRMLPRLVRIDDETVDTARPADRAALLHALPDPEAAEKALHRMAAARLLVLDERTVRISHDALLRAWPLLRGWIDADRDWLRTRQQLAADAEAWWQADKDPSLLYRGTRLAATRDSARRAAHADSTEDAGETYDLDPQLAEFLGQSRRYERRAVRIRRALVAGLCALAMLAVAGGATAWLFQRQAVDQRNRAVARLVAAEADSLRDSQPGLAKQLSLVAHQMDPDASAASLFAGLETPGVFNDEDPASDFALNSDGTRLAISTGGDVALWDTAQGKGLARFNLAKSGAVALSPNGRLVAAATPGAKAGKTPVKLWNVSTPSRPRNIAAPVGETAGIASMAFSPDGRLLALGQVTGGIQLWDITNPASPRPLRTLTGHTGKVDSVTFAPSGRLLASAGTEGTVRLWDPRDSARTSALSTISGAKVNPELSGQPLHRVAFSPDSRLLAGPGDGNESGVRLWNVRDRDRPQLADAANDNLADCQSDLVSTTFRSDGKYFATVCGSSAVLWEVTSRSRLTQVNDLSGAEIVSEGPALFAPRGYRLLHGTSHGVFLWDTENPPTLSAVASLGRTPSGFTVTTVFSDGPRRLLAVQGASHGALWDMTGKAPHKKLAHLPGSGFVGAEAAAFSPGGRILATSELSRGEPVVRLRSTSKPGAPATATIADITNGVNGLSFSPDGRVLAVADTNDDTSARTAPPSIRLFDVSTPSRPRQITSMKSGVFRITFAPKGHLLVANTADTLLSWNLSDPRHPVPLPSRRLTPGAEVSQSAFRPDGELLAVNDNRDTTRLWRVEGDRIIGEPVVVRTVGSGSGITFSPDGRTLAWTSSGGGSAGEHLELWDVKDPKFPLHRASFAYGEPPLGSSPLSYSPQGTTPLLVSTGDSVDVWNTSPEAMNYLLCQSIGDVITPAEWTTYVPDMPYDPPCD